MVMMMMMMMMHRDVVLPRHRGWEDPRGVHYAREHGELQRAAHDVGPEGCDSALASGMDGRYT